MANSNINTKKRTYVSVINTYTFGCNCKERRVVDVCGFVNKTLKLIHPTSKIEIIFDKGKRTIKMMMEHSTNFAYENPVQYKNAMKLFDLAIKSIERGNTCEVIEGAILPPY